MEDQDRLAIDEFNQLFDSVVSELTQVSADAPDNVEPNSAVETAVSPGEPEETAGEPTETPTLTWDQLIQLAFQAPTVQEAEPESAGDEPKAEAEPQQETQSEQKEKAAQEAEEEEADADDWLTRLLRGDDDDDEAEPEPAPVQKKTTEPKTRQSTNDVETLQAKIQELETRLKQAEEVAQQVVVATQLRVWVDQARQRAQEFQQMVRQQGVELNDQTIEDAMVKALGRLHENPNALEQELAVAALAEMAKRYSEVRQLPQQRYGLQQPSAPKELRTFEDYLDAVLQETQR